MAKDEKKEKKAKKSFSALVDGTQVDGVKDWELEESSLVLELETGTIEIFGMFERATITQREETPNAI